MKKFNEIPLVIHVIYGLWDIGEIPKYFRNNLSLWELQGWQIKVWYRKDIEELIESEYSDFKKIIYSIKRKVQLADLARLMVIYSKGGLYVDIDCKPVNNLFDYIQTINKNHLFFIEALISNEFANKMAIENHIRNGVPEINERLANFCFASSPKNEIIKSILDLAKKRLLTFMDFNKDYDIIFKTGPDCLTTAVSEFDNIQKVHYKEFMFHHETGNWRNNKDYSLNLIHYYLKKIIHLIQKCFSKVDFFE